MPKELTDVDKMWIRSLAESLPKHKTAPETKDIINKIEKKMDNNVTKELFNQAIDDLKEFIGVRFEENDKGHDRIEKQTTKHNGRLRKLEAKYWIASGAIIILGWVVGVGYMEVKEWTDTINDNKNKLIKIDNYFE